MGIFNKGALLLVGVFLVQDSTDDNSLQTEQERKEECIYLNSVRANYTICCEYPTLVVWLWQFQFCRQSCEATEDSIAKLCCEYRCQYVDLTGVITVTTDGEGSTPRIGLSTAGIAHSFLVSVGNDTRWEPVIKNAVQRCYDDFWQPVDGPLLCNIIPRCMYNIIDCCYTEHFLKCPLWNLHNLPECDYTYKYVSKCDDFW